MRKWRWGVNWQCGTEDVGGDQLGGRPLEHKDDADTGVAWGGNRYHFKHFVKGKKSIELDPNWLLCVKEQEMAIVWEKSSMSLTGRPF